MRAAQVREAARLLDLNHVVDGELVALEDHGNRGVVFTIGPRLFPRSLPLSLAPREHRIAADGTSKPQELPR